MRWLPYLAVVFTGCASANLGGGGGGGNLDAAGSDNPGDDADLPIGIDAAPPIDAAISVTMNQTGSPTVVATAIGCQDANALTTENSYYRIFPLSDFGITTPFHVTDVSFAVERATAGNGVSQPAQLKLGTYSGTINANSFPVGQLQLLASATIQIPQNATSVTTPIASFTPSTLTVAADTLLFAEVFIPDGRPAGNIFYMGSNAGTETHPSYIRAQDCAVTSPTAYDTAVGTAPAIRLLLTVSGTH